MKRLLLVPCLALYFISEGIFFIFPAEYNSFLFCLKSYDKPRQHIKKQRHYFANKVRTVKVMVFPVVMYGCESWTMKKGGCPRIGAFELWY